MTLTTMCRDCHGDPVRDPACRCMQLIKSGSNQEGFFNITAFIWQLCSRQSYDVQDCVSCLRTTTILGTFFNGEPCPSIVLGFIVFCIKPFFINFRFMLCADFEAYLKCQDKVNTMFTVS